MFKRVTTPFIRKKIDNKSSKLSEQPIRQFIHIPKTAGTSFRSALEKNRSLNLMFDYGPESTQTDSLIKRGFYKDRDNFGLYQVLKSTPNVVLGGHIAIQKYAGLVQTANSAVILREPFERLKSHYKHANARQSFQGSFEQFLSLSANRNIQSKYLNFVQLKSIGLVGISERYSEFLELASSRWDIYLTEYEKNKADKSFSESEESLEKHRELALSLNQQDVTIYRQAKELFEHSYECFKAKIDESRAHASYCKDTNHVNGWGFSFETEKPLMLTISASFLEEDIKVTCNEYRAMLAGKGFPRKGYVGFSLALKCPKGYEGEIDIKDGCSGKLLHTVKVL